MADSDRESGSEPLEGPGQRLKLSREQRGLSVAEVADALHLDHAMIEALEADDYDNLPPATFTKGYFRAYARHLALNEDVLLAAYERFSRGDDQRPLTAAVGAEDKAANARRGSRTGWLVLLIVVIAVGVALVALTQQRMPSWAIGFKEQVLDAVMPTEGADAEASSDASEDDGVAASAGSGEGEGNASAESNSKASDAGDNGQGGEQETASPGTASEAAGRETEDSERGSASGEANVGAPEGALATDRRFEPGTNRGAGSQPRLADQPPDSVDPSRALDNDPLTGAESLLESAQTGNVSVSGDDGSFGGPLSEAPPEPGRDTSGDRDAAPGSVGGQSGNDVSASEGTDTVSASTRDSRGDAPSEPGATETNDVASADTEIAMPSSAPVPQADTAPEQKTLVFTFEGQSWMEVRDARGRELVFELITEPGRREVRGVPPFQLVIGDVEQVDVRYEGEPVDLGAYSRQGMARLELGGS